MARRKQKETVSLPPPPHGRLASVFEDPPRKNVLLLSCMDQRLLDDVVDFMNELNLENRYDQISLAGGAMGVNRLASPIPEESQAPNASSASQAPWNPVFFHHLEAAIDKLHRPIKDVFLIDHLDCGAYKYLLEGSDSEKYKNASIEEMKKMHKTELLRLAHQVATYCHEKDAKAQA